MSVRTGDPAGAAGDPAVHDPGASRRANSRRCAGGASRPPAGPTGKRSTMSRRACRSEMLQGLASYWATDYDWRKCEAKLNALPQFMTEIDGLDIHFIHVRSGHENALPLIVTHGWPGSIIEQLKIIEPLTNPTAHGAERLGRVPHGDPVDTGLRVLRQAGRDRLGSRSHRTRLGRADETPWLSAVRSARRRLGRGGHERDGPAGSARNYWASTSTSRRRSRPPLPSRSARRPGAGRSFSRRDARIRAAELLYAEAVRLRRVHATRPQTLYGLVDSPVGLAAWLLDHGDGWGQPAAAVVSAVLGHTSHGHPAGALTRDDVLDNVTLYWLTNTVVSAARSYWENKTSLYNAADVAMPTAVIVFPGENYLAPRSWTERAYHNLIYYHRARRRPLRGLGTAADLLRRGPRGP